jgi:hypothetical protein
MVDIAEKVLVKNAESLKLFQRRFELVRVIALSATDAARQEM